MHVRGVSAITRVNIGQGCCVHSIHRNTEKAVVYSDCSAGFGYKLETILSSLLLSGRVCKVSLWLWGFSPSCSDTYCSVPFCSRKFTQDRGVLRQTAKDDLCTAGLSLIICREQTWECAWVSVMLLPQPLVVRLEVEKKWERPRGKHGMNYDVQDNKMTHHMR